MEMKQIALRAILSYVCMSQKSLNNVVENGNKIQGNRNDNLRYPEGRYGGVNGIVRNNYGTVGNGVNLVTRPNYNGENIYGYNGLVGNNVHSTFSGEGNFATWENPDSNIIFGTRPSS